MKRARAAEEEAEEETAAEAEALEAGAGAFAEAMASASGAARGAPKNTKSCKKKQRTSADDNDNNVSKNIDSTSRRRRVQSRIDLSLFTYPGFFWVDRIPPQAGVGVEAPGTSARSTSSGANKEDNTSTCSSGKNAGEECGMDSSMGKSTMRKIASSAGKEGECASAETSCKESKSNASPTAGYKSPTKRRTRKEAAVKHENGNGSAARGAMKPEAERTSAGRSKRTRNSDKSQHTSSVSSPTTPIINIGRWRDDELKRLAEGIRTHRYQWKKVAACVRTRTPNQCKVKNEELIAAQIASWPKRP